MRFLLGFGMVLMSLVVMVGFVSYSGEQIAMNYMDERDGHVYGLVKIGDKVWFKENLRYVTEQSLCYDSLPENCEKYGRLYSYEAAKTVCPENWRLPTVHDVEELHVVMGSHKIDKIAARGEWDIRKAERFSDELGLSVLPAGRIDTLTFYSYMDDRWVDTVSFHQKGVAASYWIVADDHDGSTHWHIGTPIGERKSGVHTHPVFPEIHKFSVRCMCEE